MTIENTLAELTVALKSAATELARLTAAVEILADPQTTPKTETKPKAAPEPKAAPKAAPKAEKGNGAASADAASMLDLSVDELRNAVRKGVRGRAKEEVRNLIESFKDEDGNPRENLSTLSDVQLRQLLASIERSTKQQKASTDISESSLIDNGDSYGGSE